MLSRYVRDLEVRKLHDETLRALIEARSADGVSETTITIIEWQRGKDPIWVFPDRGKPVSSMNNTAWQRARRQAGLRAVRIHDLRHTFGCRLRAAGVSMEDREVLLGHANHSMAGQYASADVGRLLKQTKLILNRQETRTVLRVAIAGTPSLWTRGPDRSGRPRNDLTCML